MSPRRPRAPTKRQLDVLGGYAELTHAHHGTPPSIRELAEHLGITASAAHEHIRALIKKGYLSRNTGTGPHYSLQALRTSLGQVELTRTPESTGYRLHAQFDEHHADAYVHDPQEPERFAILQRRATARLIATVVERALLAMEDIDLPAASKLPDNCQVLSLEIVALRSV